MNVIHHSTAYKSSRTCQACISFEKSLVSKQLLAGGFVDVGKQGFTQNHPSGSSVKQNRTPKSSKGFVTHVRHENTEP